MLIDVSWGAELDHGYCDEYFDHTRSTLPLAERDEDSGIRTSPGACKNNQKERQDHIETTQPRNYATSKLRNLEPSPKWQ
jgi:hypothetical protein